MRPVASVNLGSVLFVHASRTNSIHERYKRVESSSRTRNVEMNAIENRQQVQQLDETCKFEIQIIS